jgi:hypothetical protein
VIHAVIEPGEMVKYNPGEGKSYGPGPELLIQSDGHLHSKYLWLNLDFPEKEKQNPGRRGSQEVKQDVQYSSFLVVLHSVDRPL